MYYVWHYQASFIPIFIYRCALIGMGAILQVAASVFISYVFSSYMKYEKECRRNDLWGFFHKILQLYLSPLASHALSMGFGSTSIYEDTQGTMGILSCE